VAPDLAASKPGSSQRPAGERGSNGGGNPTDTTIRAQYAYAPLVRRARSANKEPTICSGTGILNLFFFSSQARFPGSQASAKYAKKPERAGPSTCFGRRTSPATCTPRLFFPCSAGEGTTVGITNAINTGPAHCLSAGQRHALRQKSQRRTCSSAGSTNSGETTFSTQAL